MSINLSVVFYGKGVPRRACTCLRRVSAEGRDDGREAGGGSRIVTTMDS